MSERCARRSTILPFPSSPHCAPTTTVAGTNRSLRRRARCDRPTGHQAVSSARLIRRTTIRWPRPHDVKATSAPRRSVPLTCVCRTAIDSRVCRHTSQTASYDVASGRSQTCWTVVTERLPSYDLKLPRVVPCEGRRAVAAAEDDLVPRAAPRDRHLGIRRQLAAHDRRLHGVEERQRATGGVETLLAETRDRRRARREPDHGRAHAAAARSAKRASRFWNASFSVPVPPFRCFERISSAMPAESVSSGL